MLYFIYFCFLLSVSALSSDDIQTTLLSDDNYCEKVDCVGEEYSYINGRCYCAPEYVPSDLHTKCIKCPGVGDSCDGRCCNSNSPNETLQCWHGVCQKCHNIDGDWICRDSLKEYLLVPGTEIAVSIILLLGLFGASILLYKICNIAKSRFLRNRHNIRRSSIGSLEQIVQERLRDAPPRYSTAAPPGTPVVPVTVYLIEGFVHDCSVPPPPYTPDDKTEEQRNATIHI